MKRTIALLLTLLLCACVLPTAIASSASSDFTVKDGVLVSYQGAGGKVNIPDGVYSIGDSAFAGNTSVTAVTLTSSVTAIGNKAFSGCTSLSTVSGGDNVNFVGAYAFDGTKFLTASTAEYISVGKTLIWYNNAKATSFSLPKTYVSIAPYAFSGCALTSFSSTTLTSIGEGAFYNCTSLSSVSVPAAVSYIGAYAFDGTPYLSSLGAYPVVGDGILVGYSGGAQAVVPSTVRQIAARAFADSAITTLTLPSSVFSIGKQSFMNCTSLRSISFSSGLVGIGEESFANCTSLTVLETPESLSFIGKGAFLNCTSLQSACLSGSSLYISDAAFMNCSAMQYAICSQNVRRIGDYAFSNDTALRAVSICPDTMLIGSTAFLGCKDLCVVAEPDSFAEGALFEVAASFLPHGDVDIDGRVSILDVTRIQRHLAELTTLAPAAVCAADTDMDGLVLIYDATHLQLLLADID